MTYKYDRLQNLINGCFVHHHGDAATKTEREKRALHEFSKAIAQQFGQQFTVLDSADADMLTAQIDGASVDGVIAVDEQHVAIELLGYWPNGDRGDSLNDDHKFRAFIANEVGTELVHHGVGNINVWYRNGNRPDGSVRLLVPRQTQWIRVAAELIALVKTGAEYWIDRECGRGFVLRNDRAIARDARKLIQIPGKYPILTASLSEVCIRQRAASLRGCEIHSMMSGGCVGLDEQWLAQKLCTKAEKSELSAKRANELPLWLIVHTDELSINQSIPEPHLERVPEVCRRALSSQPHHFDRVYWCHSTGYLDAAKITSVLE